MLFLILGIIILVSLVLWAVVLIQNPKGGGLSSSFGGGSVTNLIGAKKSVDFVERATWYLGIAVVVLVLLSTSMLPRSGSSGFEPQTKDEIEGINAPAPDQGAPVGGDNAGDASFNEDASETSSGNVLGEGEETGGDGSGE